jgi:hypothetical protein
MSTGRKAGADVLGLAESSRAVGGPERPSIDVARRRLGGQATTPSVNVPGSLVRVALPNGDSALGVLLWASDSHCDVWFEDGIARRTPAAVVTLDPGPTPESLWRIAAEIRLFMSLSEGQRVRWERKDAVAEGRIVEKCRYGAIVVLGDGKVVAVGFRRLWPALVDGVA